MSTVEHHLKAAIRDVPDFPKPGILFRDITPVLEDPALCRSVVEAFATAVGPMGVQAVAGVESRGFLFGLPLAMRLDVPFITVRKKGRLPFHTASHKYELEYGSAEIEVHVDAIKPGMRVLVHDDLLATGGTAAACAALVRAQGGVPAGFAFVIELSALGGGRKLGPFGAGIVRLATY
ncbi:MAG: adenine phosphoribosyltransferase [Flavobacteriales bacterium]|nr:adenine phosphoribosyltransferase [Flavobacteriales bacterium]